MPLFQTLELDDVLTAKADAAITIEGLKREVNEKEEEKTEMERQKEAMAVQLHLVQDKDDSLGQELAQVCHHVIVFLLLSLFDYFILNYIYIYILFNYYDMI